MNGNDNRVNSNGVIMPNQTNNSVPVFPEMSQANAVNSQNQMSSGVTPNVVSNPVVEEKPVDILDVPESNNVSTAPQTNIGTSQNQMPFGGAPSVVSNQEKQVDVLNNAESSNNSTSTQVDKVNKTESNGLGDEGFVNEKLERVEVEYTPPSNKKLGVMLFLFVIILAFIVFLPMITDKLQEYKAGDVNYEEPQKITTGSLVCTLDTSTSNLDKEYYLKFDFKDNKLEKSDFTITTKGDINLDSKTLDDLANTCNLLKSETASMEGVGIRCDYIDGKLVERQVYDLSLVDNSLLSSVFSEAGGINPEYKYGDDIDMIEKNMNASGYDCSRNS